VTGYRAENKPASQSGSRRIAISEKYSVYVMTTAATGMMNTHRCGVQLLRRDWLGGTPLLSVIGKAILNGFQRDSGSSARGTET